MNLEIRKNEMKGSKVSKHLFNVSNFCVCALFPYTQKNQTGTDCNK